MEKIQKGQKAKYTGLLLTTDEATDYKKIQDTLTLFKTRNTEYQQKYHRQYDKTFIY